MVQQVFGSLKTSGKLVFVYNEIMKTTFDVIVLGLGANGSSAIYHLAKAGTEVLGMDRFAPPHNRGSSHGQSRIIRQAYHENPLYVPFVKEAYKLWQELEGTTGKKLLLETGGIVLGNEKSSVVKGAKLSAEMYDLPHELLNRTEIQTCFPALKPSEDTVAVLDKTAGILFPETCIQTFLGEAQKAGASLRYNEKVLRIVPSENAVEIITDKDTYQAAKLIVSAGAWLNELLPELWLPLAIERQVLYWFKDKKTSPHFTPDALPIYIWEYSPNQIFYGFPDLGDGIKTAFYHGGRTILPDALAADVSEEEIIRMRRMVQTQLAIEPAFNYAVTCMYTNTPDEHFIIDFHPQYKNIIVASPCSGHGFKFSSVTGRLLCDMIMDKPVSFDLSPFRIDRFQ